MTYGLPYTPQFYFETNPAKLPYHRAIFWLFTIMPWNPLAKAILDMAAATNTHVHPGMRWSERSSYCMALHEGETPPDFDPLTTWQDVNCVFPVNSCFIALAVQFFLYTLLAVWVDNVLPNSLGVSRHPLFFLHRAFWRPRPLEQGAALAKLVAEGEARMAAEKAAMKEGVRFSVAGGADEDEDVGAESARIKRSLGQKVGSFMKLDESEWLAGSGKGGATRRSAAGRRRSSAGGAALAAQRQWTPAKSVDEEPHPNYAVEVFGLKKVFPLGWWASHMPRWLGGRPGARDFWAIKDSWFGIEQGSCFCLLGPNGAGKTTTINCLTGARGAGVGRGRAACLRSLVEPLHRCKLACQPMRASSACTTHTRFPLTPHPLPVPASGALPPTAGDALIYGESLCGEGGLDRVRSLMGVCPQFDVLWNELSGREHLTIYGHIKGLKFSEVRQPGRPAACSATAPRGGSPAEGQGRVTGATHACAARLRGPRGPAQLTPRFCY